jgi:hypothetical protein
MWILIAEGHIAEGKGQTAVEAIGNAVKIAQELVDKPFELAVLKVKGRSESAAGLFQDASTTFEEAKLLTNDKIEEAGILACIVDNGLAEGEIETSVQAADDQRDIFQAMA